MDKFLNTFAVVATAALFCAIHASPNSTQPWVYLGVLILAPIVLTVIRRFGVWGKVIYWAFIGILSLVVLVGAFLLTGKVFVHLSERASTTEVDAKVEKFIEYLRENGPPEEWDDYVPFGSWEPDPYQSTEGSC